MAGAQSVRRRGGRSDREEQAVLLWRLPGTVIHTQPSTLQAFTPTAAMLSGDFTALASPACNTGRQIALRAPFVNNQVSPSQFDPTALKYLQYIPVSTDPCGRYQ